MGFCDVLLSLVQGVHNMNQKVGMIHLHVQSAIKGLYYLDDVIH